MVGAEDGARITPRIEDEESSPGLIGAEYDRAALICCTNLEIKIYFFRPILNVQGANLSIFLKVGVHTKSKIK